ncbi:MAG: MobP3 family relaxase, partial [Ruminiclostridium sp.]
ASDFILIALEQNFDKIGKRKNYVDYIATRPRVEKMGTHGLFTGGDDAIVLSRVADEVANHTGNVWTPIISLRREDAIRTGYDNAEAWHNMLSYFAPEIAESMKIPIRNFRWYAAFHNESHHPHLHMVCYSVNPADGYLTKKGIERIKSGLVKNIFKNEMHIIYEEQSQRRDQLKAESRDAMLKLISEIKSGVIQNPKIEELLLSLSERLKVTNGKRVYGYLQPNVKAIVDEIIDELSKEEAVAKAYELWYEMREEVLLSYMDELSDRLPLSKQKEFKSIKNMIVAEADNIAKCGLSFEEVEIAEPEDIDSFAEIESSEIAEFELPDDEIADDAGVESHDVYVKWTDEYKLAREYLFGTEEAPQDFEKSLELLLAEAENGNVLAMHDLGRIHANGLGVDGDNDKAHEYYEKALSGFEQVEAQKAWKYSEYRIGKMFAQGLGTEQDYETAAQWFELSTEKKYKYAQYSLGGLYYRGQGVEPDFQTAFSLYLKSAEQGFPYADYEVAKMY